MNPNAIILAHLAECGYSAVTRGQLVVSILPQDLPLYQALHSSQHVRCPTTRMFGKVYQLTKRGWFSLTQTERDSIMESYQVWFRKTKPSIPGPEWIKWTTSDNT